MVSHIDYENLTNKLLLYNAYNMYFMNNGLINIRGKYWYLSCDLYYNISNSCNVKHSTINFCCAIFTHSVL